MTDGLEITERDGAMLLRLRVSPGARASRVIGVHGGALKLAVAAPAEQGKANHEVLRLLAKLLDVTPSQLELVAGHTSRDKRVRVDGIARDDALQRLADAMN